MAIKKIGNSSKNTTYLAMMKGITNYATHPRMMGVRMQAHHVISGDGVALSGIGERMEKFGYNINLKDNLVFIPCTLQGACYLGVQPHRGNHTAPGKEEPEPDENDYVDDSEPSSYHKLVAKRLVEAERDFPIKCAKKEIGKNKAVDLLDAVAIAILNLIQDHPTKAPLTSVAEHFVPGKKVGCGGHDSVPILEATPVTCPAGRNHRNKKARRGEKILFVSDGKYRLTMGK